MLPASSNADDARIFRNYANFETDSTQKKEIQLQTSDGPLDNKVEYASKDSMIFNIEEQKIYLYGEAVINYGATNLKAARVVINMVDNTMEASGLLDSLGIPYGRPVFKEGEQEFTSSKMHYNFKTKKGRISDAITQQGDGYIHGKQVKMISEDVMYIKNGKYTTCDKDTPHFHIEATKLKLIKNDKIVTGPAYLKIANVPTPLAVPFGFFPNTPKQSSGIVIPTPGQLDRLGFFLINGGYYLALSDYMDLELTGDIYSRGSWGTRAVTNYAKRYGFKGNIDVKYSVLQQGIEGLSDYSEVTNIFVRWKHIQDPKARPNSRFSADVNAGSVNNFQNTYTTNNADFLTNTFKSNIAYSKSFAGTPLNFSLNGSHSQNNRDSSVTVNLPEATLNMTRVYPFKFLERKGKFFKKLGLSSLGISYVTNIKNIISSHQDSIFNQETIDDMQNGMRHSMPISTNIKISNWTLTPAANLTERWYLQTYQETYNADSNRIETGMINGFQRAFEWGVNSSLTTKIYGMYTFNSKKLLAIRHVLTPRLNFNYRPDFTDSKYGYYKEVQTDADTNNTRTYSVFQNTIYGGPGRGEIGALSLNLMNNLEMKIKSKKDTLDGTKKVKIIDVFNIRSSYNFLADSMQFGAIKMNLRTTLFKIININISDITINPYAIDNQNGDTYNVFEIDRSGSIGRITSAAAAVGFRFKSKQGGKKRANKNKDLDIEAVNNNLDQYIDFTVPWTFSMNYNVRYSKPKYVSTITNAITFRGDIKLTDKWKIGFRSGYDFNSKDFTYTTFDLYRDMHCWELTINAIPFGRMRGYNATLKVKSSILQDLKLTRQNNRFDGYTD